MPSQGMHASIRLAPKVGLLPISPSATLQKGKKMNIHPNLTKEDTAKIEQCVESLADLRYVVDECGSTSHVFRSRCAIRDFIEHVMEGNIPGMMWLWAAPTAPQMAPAAVDPVCEPRVQPRGKSDVCCTCDAIGDGACSIHARENELQDLWLSEKAEVRRLRQMLSDAGCLPNPSDQRAGGSQP